MDGVRNDQIQDASQKESRWDLLAQIWGVGEREKSQA